MALKKLKPAPAKGTGSGLDSLAASNAETTLFAHPHQDAIAWLARRARISVTVAGAVAAANHWGLA